MISRWNYVSMTIVMGVMLLMFQLTNVMLERWNNYEENNFVKSWEELPGESDAHALAEDEADPARGMVVYIGSGDASAREVMRQWAVYTKQNFMSCETLEDYRNSAEELEQYPEKIVGVHSADIDWEDEAAWKCLEENADGDTSLVFCGLPEAGTVKGSAALRRLLGVVRVRSEETTAEGLRLSEGFLLGGGAEYRTVDPEENERLQDMDLTFPWYTLLEDTEVYLRGVFDDETLEEDDMPPVIWRTQVKDARAYMVNGDYMEEAFGLGLLSAMWAGGKAYEIYPVVNAQNLVAVNYPGMSLENDEAIQKIYDQSLGRLFRDRVWPVLIAAYRQNALGLTCMMTPQFDYADENLPEQEQLLHYMKRLNEERAETGLSGFRVSDTPLERKLLEDGWFMEGTLPDYQFTSFYSTEEQGLEQALEDELLQSVRTVVSRYDGELDIFGYLNENVTRQPLLSDGVRYTYRQDLLTKCVETALGYTSVMVDMGRIAYPDSDDPLNEMNSGLGWNLQNYFKKYENFEGTTLTESDERIRGFLAADYAKRTDGDTITLEVEHPGESAWFVLRTEGKRVKSVEGGQSTLLEDGAYLIEATEKSVVITLRNQTRR